MSTVHQIVDKHTREMEGVVVHEHFIHSECSSNVDNGLMIILIFSIFPESLQCAIATERIQLALKAALFYPQETRSIGRLESGAERGKWEYREHAEKNVDHVGSGWNLMKDIRVRLQATTPCGQEGGRTMR